MVVNIDIKMNNYILNLDLSMNHKFILALADTFKDNGCFMSNAKIGKMVGLSASRVSHIISELVTTGYLTREITYKEDSKEVDKRTIFFNKAIKKVQEVASKIKQLGGKNKQLKQQHENQAYTETTTKVGTQNVQQVIFGQKYYQKRPNHFCNTHSHNWDFDELDKMAEEYLDRRLEEIRNEREGRTNEKSS